MNENGGMESKLEQRIGMCNVLGTAEAATIT